MRRCCLGPTECHPLPLSKLKSSNAEDCVKYQCLTRDLLKVGTEGYWKVMLSHTDGGITNPLVQQNQRDRVHEARGDHDKIVTNSTTFPSPDFAHDDWYKGIDLGQKWYLYCMRDALLGQKRPDGVTSHTMADVRKVLSADQNPFKRERQILVLTASMAEFRAQAAQWVNAMEELAPDVSMPPVSARQFYGATEPAPPPMPKLGDPPPMPPTPELTASHNAIAEIMIQRLHSFERWQASLPRSRELALHRMFINECFAYEAQRIGCRAVSVHILAVMQ